MIQDRVDLFLGGVIFKCRFHRHLSCLLPQKVMIKNPTDINEMNNHLSPQNIEPPQKTTTYDFGKQSPGLGHAQRCGRFKPFNGIPTQSLN